MNRLSSLSLAVALVGCGAVSAQTWIQATPANPPTALRSAGIAHHPLAGLVVYGGLATGNVLLADTRAWNGTDWATLAPATTPPGRWGHRMVYDSHRGVLVTFGGRSPTITATANDTWEFDGVDWHQVVTPTSPSPRAFYSMAFDERRGRVVMFGIQSGSASGAQTWEYDGTTWQQATTATTPPSVETPAMAYDKGRGVVVLFGGWNGTPPGTMYGTTWEYDGNDWTQRFPATTPTPRYRAGCAYDDARGRVVMYGGFGNATALQDTWEYDGNDWLLVASTGPTRSTESCMAYDPAMTSVLHFGGSGPSGTSNETWTFAAPTTAIAAPFGSGCATSAGVPTLAPTSTPQLNTSYGLALSNGALSTLAVVVHGLDNLQLAPGIWLPIDLGFAGIGGCRLEVRNDLLLTEAVLAGTMTHAVAIPNDPLLAGTALYTQVLVLDAAAPNGFGGMSNAVHGVLGQ